MKFGKGGSKNRFVLDEDGDRRVVGARTDTLPPRNEKFRSCNVGDISFPSNQTAWLLVGT